jgi:hypothetical protein
VSTVEPTPNGRERAILYGVVAVLLLALAIAAMAAWRHTRTGQLCSDPVSTLTRAELAIVTTYCPHRLAGADL